MLQQQEEKGVLGTMLLNEMRACASLAFGAGNSGLCRYRQGAWPLEKKKTKSGNKATKCNPVPHQPKQTNKQETTKKTIKPPPPRRPGSTRRAA
jgi:hypothetical protein